MKINKLKVNSFGNLQNKEIDLSDGINIIYGENESGKSTLLKYIINMFYGISKNKRGKEFSDYDRYKPWNTEEFSGKLEYELDNNKKYEIFRDFNKKSPKIYNENGEDISKEFSIDKTTGSEFFVEQTGIDENMFLSSLVSMQQEVVLNQNDQNILIQKLANFANSGDDNISYKKAIEKINKKQKEEIGTSRSSGRPINNLKEEKFKLQDELGELEEYKDKKYEIEDERNTLIKNIEKNELKLNYLKEIKKINDEEKIEREKNNLKEKLNIENKEKINELNIEKNNLNSKIKEIKNDSKNKKIKKDKKINYLFIFTELVLLVSLFVDLFILKTDVISRVAGSIAILNLAIFVFLKIRKNNNTFCDQEKEINEKINKINLEMNLLENNSKKIEEELNKNNEKINFEFNVRKEKLKNSYINKIDNINDISMAEIEELEKKLNKNKLDLHALELDTECIVPKLENMANIEERLEQLKEEEEELIKNNEIIELTKDILEKAYIKMKENVTPEFTKNLSSNIEKISNGKYKNIKINDDEGIIVEKENGEYIEASKLSVGTIDQLYISLRFASINELSKENMPILLDESFAYCDYNRLKNILIYLNEELKGKQIIIFTCTNRERDILNELNINYNSINL